jgi:dTDP-4-dehydrorhamnose reductase
LKVAITGANGQLAIALKRRLEPDHSIVALTRGDLDISDARACLRVLGRERPDVLLNCAAHTAVDRAEAEREQAFSINAEGPRQLGRTCQTLGIVPIHFSTDYVFDGTQRRPYVESDPTSPQSVYGESKLRGELALAQECRHYLIMRLSWVYGNDGANFYKTMLRLAAERPELRVVGDQFGVPNYTGDIADAVAGVLALPLPEIAAHTGLYHLSAPGATSWCEFARAIIDGVGLQHRVTVQSISTSEYPTAAKRPAYSVLDGSRFAATFGVAMPAWQDALQRCIAARSPAA